jgi:hypothetical protein
MPVVIAGLETDTGRSFAGAASLLRSNFMSAREPSWQPDAKSSQIFTLEINGRPTLVFEATSFAEASEICLDADLRSDLSALTSDGILICAQDATLSPRPAMQEEIAAFRHAVELTPPSNEPTMAFLIKIDGVLVVAVGPPS